MSQDFSIIPASLSEQEAQTALLQLLTDGLNKVSSSNSSTTALNAGQTFTGAWEDVSLFNSIVVALSTDQSGTLYLEFSPDGVNVDGTVPPILYTQGGSNPPHILKVTRKYFRARFSNTSLLNQVYFRLQCIKGAQGQITSTLNSVIAPSADAILVRPLDFNLMVSEGLYFNRSSTIKDGINFDIDTGSVPEDITNEGGVYAGFVSAAGAAEIVVSGADTGTVYYSYMATDTDLDYVFGSKAVAGAGTYSLGHNIWRCNFAYFVNTGSPTALNVADISIRLTAAPASVFCVIPQGYSQSFCAAYTVPYGSSVYIDRFNGNLRGSTSGSLDGVFYYKPYGESPRYRFPFELQYGSLYFDDVDYLIKIPERVDIVPRILTSSANNLFAKFSYRLLKVK